MVTTQEFWENYLKGDEDKNKLAISIIMANIKKQMPKGLTEKEKAYVESFMVKTVIDDLIAYLRFFGFD